MGVESRKWINENLPKLRLKYPNKTIIVCNNRVIKVFDGIIDPIQLNEVARQICEGKDWSYTFVSEEEEEYIL
ncbi:MAG: hypothetical protein QMD13_02755 [Candidatus Bathyarchaeia archaeon]|nr:hypothetical protein [Candidatus Bathyarchaeia archaeon]MDI6904400.1 hypothetical protein [Candidatus Bathyarchaeia archaeon]